MALEQRKQRAPLKAEKKSQPGAAVAIPDKLYFRIGEVAELCGLPAHVLRFWETEFPQLKPNKGGSGQRLYRKQDVEFVLELQRLLHQEKFTIAGARQLLAEKRRSGPDQTPRAAKRTLQPLPAAPDLQTMRGELRAILGLLTENPLLGAGAHTTPAASRKIRPAAPKLQRTAAEDTPLLF